MTAPASAALTCAPAGLQATAVTIATRAPDWAALTAGRPWFALYDEDVVGLHGDLAPDGLPGCVAALGLTGGEGAKTFATLERVLQAMVGLDRGACLVAIGGGSIGDLGGLAAALYLRGIALVQVPTSLLAMLDSSVGGKTAINLPAGKNLVGTVWPAAAVHIDPRRIATLSEAEFASGLGEAIKMAVGLEPALFDVLEEAADAVLARDPATLARVVELAVAAKIRIVEQDAHEAGPRRLLNLGHTVGHALEAHAEYRVPHGVAVAEGMHVALALAQERGTLPASDAGAARALLGRYGFPPPQLPPVEDLMPWLGRDKKAAAGGVHFVLPMARGASRTEWMSLADLEAALRRYAAG